MDVHGDPPLSAATTALIRPFKLNNKILMGGAAVLLAVCLVLVGLRVYVKLFLRPPRPPLPAAAPFHRRPAQQPKSVDGLTKSIINSLPLFSYKSPPSQEQSPPYCAVCLHEFSENEEGRVLPSCKHSFHTQCIDAWFDSHTTCPLCRTMVTISVEEIASKIVEDSTDPAPLLRCGSYSYPAAEMVITISAQKSPSKRMAESTSVQDSALPAPLLRCGSFSFPYSMIHDSMVPLNSAQPNDIRLVLGDHSRVSSQSSS